MPVNSPLMDHLSAVENPWWYMELLTAVLDETEDTDSALRIADKLYEEMPNPPEDEDEQDAAEEAAASVNDDEQAVDMDMDWHSFRTARETEGAIDQYGNRRYGNEAERVLHHHDDKPIANKNPTDKHSASNILASAGKKFLNLVKSGAHKFTAFEHVAVHKFLEKFSQLPTAIQLPVAGAFGLAFSSYIAGNRLASSLAQEMGASAENAHQTAMTLATWDVLTAKVAPLVVGALLGPAGAAVTYLLPMGSLTYLAYSGVKNRSLLIPAAKRAVHDIGTALAKSMSMSDKEEAAREFMSRLKELGDQAEWYTALVHAAFDFNEIRDLPEAMQVANEAIQDHSMPVEDDGLDMAWEQFQTKRMKSPGVHDRETGEKLYGKAARDAWEHQDGKTKTESKSQSVEDTKRKEQHEMTREEFAQMWHKAEGNGTRSFEQIKKDLLASGGTQKDIDEFIDLWAGGHKEEVRRALASGKPIPPEVLADYPELIEKKTKEPWEMTREEAVKGNVNDDTVLESKETLSKYPGKISVSDLKALAKKRLGNLFAGVVLRHYGGGSQVEVLKKKNGYHGATIVRDAVYPVPGYTTNEGHRAAVETALAAGKTVPPEVLADYPDLAAKYRTPTEMSANATLYDALQAELIQRRDEAIDMSELKPLKPKPLKPKPRKADNAH